MRVVCITGSRNWTELRPIQLAMLGADLVVHGGATGADAIAHSAALGMEIDTLVMHAKWHEFGKRAGPERNERMADYAQRRRNEGDDVECFAFPMGEARGTRDCIARMRAHGIRTTVYGEHAEVEVR